MGVFRGHIGSRSLCLSGLYLYTCRRFLGKSFTCLAPLLLCSSSFVNTQLLFLGITPVGRRMPLLLYANLSMLRALVVRVLTLYRPVLCVVNVQDDGTSNALR